MSSGLSKNIVGGSWGVSLVGWGDVLRECLKPFAEPACFVCMYLVRMEMGRAGQGDQCCVRLLPPRVTLTGALS